MKSITHLFPLIVVLLCNIRLWISSFSLQNLTQNNTQEVKIEVLEQQVKLLLQKENQALKIKALEQQVKLLLQKENQTLKIEALEQQVKLLLQKVGGNSEYCQLQPDDICGPCTCRDDNRLLSKYYCDCQNLQPRRDCLEFKQYGIVTNGVYKIHQNILKIIQVYCDQTTDGGGWTVVQRRIDGSVNFFRDWENCKHGFGQLQRELWLGNENIFTLILRGLHPRGSKLRIDMTNNKQIKKFAKYENFQIGNANTKYMLHVSGFSGTVAHNAFNTQNQQKFTTFDNDNDNHRSANCGMYHFGGWWFNRCYLAHLNGLYYAAGKMSPLLMIVLYGLELVFIGYQQGLIKIQILCYLLR